MTTADDNAKAPQRAPAAMDESRLSRLLTLAGPVVADELLTRLDQDLDRVARTLSLALAQGDLPAVRAQTHVLIGLAGTIGALALEADARALNAAAHLSDQSLPDQSLPDQSLPDQSLPDSLVRPVLSGLQALRALVAARRATGKAAR